MKKAYSDDEYNRIVLRRRKTAERERHNDLISIAQAIQNQDGCSRPEALKRAYDIIKSKV